MSAALLVRPETIAERDARLRHGITELLGRLNRVHQTAPNRWRAVCPAHESKHRTQTLAIHEAADGTVLLKCFAGCAAVDVVAALGLEMRNLFPRSTSDHRAATPMRVPAGEVLALIDHEVLISLLILSDVRKSRRFDDEQLTRLTLASDRISHARSHAAPARAKAEV
jgi:hypothetical protein